MIDAVGARFYSTSEDSSSSLLVLRMSVKVSDALNFSLFDFRNRLLFLAVLKISSEKASI